MTPSKADLERAIALMTQCVVLQQQGRDADALQCLDQALTIVPNFPSALVKRGTMYQAQGRYRESLADFDHCLKIKPDLAHAVQLRDATLLLFLKSVDDSLAGDGSTPPMVERLCERVILLLRLGRTAEAMRTLEQVLGNDEGCVPALIQLGNFLASLSLPDEALRCYERILAHDPADGVALFNRGNMLQRNARYVEALASYAGVLTIRPDMPEAMMEQAHCRLAMGDLPTGWRLFEARWNTRQLSSARLKTPAPQWQGEMLGDTDILLLWAEQGLGDTMQFVRYLKPVMHRVKHIVLRVPESLRVLLRYYLGSLQLAENNGNTLRIVGNTASLVPHIAHCPLMSLPLMFNTDLDTIPAEIPYLYAKNADSAKWQGILSAGKNNSRLRVGLVWAGGQRLLNNPTRDMSLASLKPLLEQDVEWISLQKSLSATDKELLQSLPQVRCVGDELTDFSDTAGLLGQLDLLISVDSSVAHLAGAMGKPVWLMLRKSGEWRWMANRADTPWYPGHRIFRQKAHGDWSSVVQEIVQQLLCR